MPSSIVAKGLELNTSYRRVASLTIIYLIHKIKHVVRHSFISLETKQQS